MWSRNKKGGFVETTLTSILFVGCPIIVFYYLVNEKYFQCDLTGPIKLILNKCNEDINLKFSMYDLYISNMIVITWITFQIILYLIPDFMHKIIPDYNGGIKKGATTPGNNVLDYNINGLQSLFLSLIIYLGLCWYEIINPHFVYQNWIYIIGVLCFYSYILSLLVYIKGKYYPTHENDVIKSSSKFYDYFMGVELNPRIGSFDFKLFFNGRPGIIGWAIINLSFMISQYQINGYITNSMVIVNILQFLYIFYFFYREDWYLKTLDIMLDHFGWMFCFGDLVWLPSMYTLQALYLVSNPIVLSNFYALCVFIVGIFGFYIFSASNDQKYKFRNNTNNLNFNNTIPCEYVTSDGKNHQSNLLISGWWSYGRHINYTGDIILSLAYSMACGFSSFYPYFYVIYLSCLLFHRSIRDEIKCKHKYGKSWDIYKSKVPYVFIPWVF